MKMLVYEYVDFRLRDRERESKEYQLIIICTQRSGELMRSYYVSEYNDNNSYEKSSTFHKILFYKCERQKQQNCLRKQVVAKNGRVLCAAC